MVEQNNEESNDAVDGAAGCSSEIRADTRIVFGECEQRFNRNRGAIFAPLLRASLDISATLRCVVIDTGDDPGSQVLLSCNTCSGSCQKASFNLMKHNFGRREKAWKNVILDNLPCRCLEDSLAKALDIGKENTLRVIDLNEAGNRESESLPGASQNVQSLCVADSSQSFKIVHGFAREACIAGYLLQGGAAGNHIEAAFLAATSQKPVRVERNVPDLAGAALVSAIEIAVDVMCATYISPQNQAGEVPQIARPSKKFFANSHCICIVA
jgi:hypothetical protein